MAEIGDSIWITDRHADIFWEARVTGTLGPWLIIATADDVPGLVFRPETSATKGGIYHSVPKPEPREGIFIYPYHETKRKR